MSIIDRIRAHGGEVIRGGWRFTLRPGRLTPAALEWLKVNREQMLCEAWPEYDAFQERAAIKEYCGGMSRDEAEAAAYAEVMNA